MTFDFIIQQVTTWKPMLFQATTQSHLLNAGSGALLRQNAYFSTTKQRKAQLKSTVSLAISQRPPMELRERSFGLCIGLAQLSR